MRKAFSEPLQEMSQRVAEKVTSTIVKNISQLSIAQRMTGIFCAKTMLQDAELAHILAQPSNSSTSTSLSHLNSNPGISFTVGQTLVGPESGQPDSDEALNAVFNAEGAFDISNISDISDISNISDISGSEQDYLPSTLDEKRKSTRDFNLDQNLEQFTRENQDENPGERSISTKSKNLRPRRKGKMPNFKKLSNFFWHRPDKVVPVALETDSSTAASQTFLKLERQMDSTVGKLSKKTIEEEAPIGFAVMRTGYLKPFYS